MSILDDALFYADLNISVHPLRDGVPGSDRSKTPDYRVETTTDAKQLKLNLKGHRSGIGGTLPRGMVALDIDVWDRKRRCDKVGIRQLEELNDILGVELRSLSRTHLTGSTDSEGHRGMHLLFTVPDDYEYSLIGVARALGLRSTKELAFDLRGHGRGNLVLPHSHGYDLSTYVTQLVVPAPGELVELMVVSDEEEFPVGGKDPKLVLQGSGGSKGEIPAGVATYWRTQGEGTDKSLHAYFGIRWLLDLGWTVEEIQTALLSRSWAVLDHYREHWRDWRAGARADVENIAEKVSNGRLQSTDNRNATEQLADFHSAMTRDPALQLWRREPIAERVLLCMTEISARRKSMKVHAPVLTVARRISASDKSVERALKLLKERGWLKVYAQGGADQATEWRLTVPVGLARGGQEQVARVLPKEGSWQALFGRGGLPRPALRILERLLTGQVETRTELSAALSVPKGTVSKSVTAFLELGLVVEKDNRAIAMAVDQYRAERICRSEARRRGLIARVQKRNGLYADLQAGWKDAKEIYREDKLVGVLEGMDAADARAEVSGAQLEAESAAHRELQEENPLEWRLDPEMAHQDW